MVDKHNNINFTIKNTIYIFLFLIALTHYTFSKEPEEVTYEKIDYLNSLPCSQHNIEIVLKKLKNRYEEEFAFLTNTAKFVEFSPYLYFVLRCIPIEKITKAIKNTSYTFKRNLLFLKHKYIIENHLQRCIDPVEYKYGHYEGQHTRIWKLPNKRWVFLILKNIINNPEYPYIIPYIDIHYYKAIRILAVDALSESKYNKKVVIKFLKKLVSIQRFEDYIFNNNLYDLTHPALMSLAVLGEKQFVNRYIAQLQFLKYVYLFHGLVHLYYYIHSNIVDLLVYTQQYKMAVQYFKELTAVVSNEILFYNMACLYSLMGKKRLALRMLRKAIKAGYSDLRWLKKDKELDIIRNTKTFKLIIKYLEKKLKKR